MGKNVFKPLNLHVSLKLQFDKTALKPQKQYVSMLFIQLCGESFLPQTQTLTQSRGSFYQASPECCSFSLRFIMQLKPLIHHPAKKTEPGFSNLLLFSHNRQMGFLSFFSFFLFSCQPLHIVNGRRSHGNPWDVVTSSEGVDGEPSLQIDALSLGLSLSLLLGLNNGEHDNKAH